MKFDARNRKKKNRLRFSNKKKKEPKKTRWKSVELSFGVGANSNEKKGPKISKKK